MFVNLFFSFAILFTTNVYADVRTGKNFERVIFVIFENTDYTKTIKQPYFKYLAESGATFTNLSAVSHPSQPNYVALTSGAIHGVKNDGPINLDVRNIVDLLEGKNISWKVYAEDYPSNCFLGSTAKGYARKHNPFISFLNVQKNPQRCSRIVSAELFAQDALNATLPQYIFYIPNNKNNGHDTGAAYASNWYEKTFSKYFSDSQFMKDTIIVSTFDEDGGSVKNHIYTSIVGPAVEPNSYNESLTLYSLLKMVEDNWNLGDLGEQDSTAPPIPEIWR